MNEVAQQEARAARCRQLALGPLCCDARSSQPHFGMPRHAWKGGMVYLWSASGLLLGSLVYLWAAYRLLSGRAGVLSGWRTFGQVYCRAGSGILWDGVWSTARCMIYFLAGSGPGLLFGKVWSTFGKGRVYFLQGLVYFWAGPGLLLGWVSYNLLSVSGLLFGAGSVLFTAGSGLLMGVQGLLYFLAESGLLFGGV
eukprot:4050386-Pyramimonas_sp.AAC.1